MASPVSVFQVSAIIICDVPYPVASFTVEEKIFSLANLID